MNDEDTITTTTSMFGTALSGNTDKKLLGLLTVFVLSTGRYGLVTLSLPEVTKPLSLEVPLWAS